MRTFRNTGVFPYGATRQVGREETSEMKGIVA